MKLLTMDENIKVCDIELSCRDALQHNPEHTHNYYEFLLVSNGRAIHHVNNTAEIISFQQLHFIRPSDFHYYDDYYDSSFAYYNLHIPPSEMERIAKSIPVDCSHLFNAKTPPTITLPHADYLFLTEKLNQFATMKSSDTKTMLYELILNEVIYLLLTQNNDTASKVPDWFNNLLTQIQNPDVFVQGLQCVISLSGYSQAYLNRIFKKYLDLTPTQYINNLRLDHTLNLIQKHSMSSLTASQMSGFNHYGYFSSLFKKRFGCMPRDFK